jgi:hypothetical protein
MTSQPNQESTMNNQIANTEIRALDDAELNMISGGGDFFSVFQNIEKNIRNQIAQIAQRDSALAALGAMDPFSGGPGKSHYSR